MRFEATSQVPGPVRIPAAPAVLTDLQELMQRDEPDIEAVAATLSRDPGLSALVLMTLNSPFFGLRNPVTSVRQATVLLGVLNLANIVAGLALRRAMEDAGGPAPEYRDSPVNIGLVAARLAQRLPGVLSDEAYMLGLFYDAGVPLMRQCFDGYRTFQVAADGNATSIIPCEQQRYQTNHAVIGYCVAQGWGLPAHIGDLVLRHHDVEGVLAEGDGSFSAKGGLLAALKMAEHIDRRYRGREQDAEWDAVGREVLAYAGISAAGFEDIVEDMIELLGRG